MPILSEFNDFTPVDARLFNQALFELYFSNWGQRVVNADPTIAAANLQYPLPGQQGLQDSLAAIAIGPRSTVDRFWISYNRQKTFNTTQTFSGTPDRARRVSLNAPMVFAQATQSGVVAPATNLGPNVACIQPAGGTIYLYPYARQSPSVNNPMGITFPLEQDNTCLPQNYVSGVDGTTMLGFGTNAPGVGAVSPASPFVQPLLHAYLYLKPPVLPLPVSRFPLNYFVNWTGGQAVPAARTLIAQIPVFGRAHIRLWGTCPTSTCVFDVGFIRGLSETDAQNLESLEVIGAAERKLIAIDGPCADYMNVYATPDAPSTVLMQIACYDSLAGYGNQIKP